MRIVLVLTGLIAALASGSGPVVAESRHDGVVFLLELKEVELTTIPGDGVGYTSIQLPGAGFTNETGKPLVPVYRQLIEIPYGARVEVEARLEDVKRYELDRPLYPRQHPVPKSGPQPDFVRDEKAYSRDEFVPCLGARLVETVFMRGHRLALVEIMPVSYNPVQNAAEVAGRMTVTVRWNGADWEKTRRRHQRYDSPAFAGRLDGVVANRDLFDYPPPELPVGYLVITPDEWEQNLIPLAQWRRRKGFHVFVRNLSQVGGSSAEVVKAYIQDAYDNWPIPPSFVLLVGDVDRIGYFTGQGTGSPPTDLNFAMVEGSDYFPDIDVSRASVANVSQLDSLVAKIVTYEQNSWTSGTEWLKKAYFIASADGGHHQVAEGTHAHVMEKIRPLGVECDSLWLYYGSGTPITTAINSGRSWVTYSGHGGRDCWADPSPDFDVSAVHALTNAEVIPYVQTYACLSGDFTYSECFSEAWIRTGKRGGIAHIASSVSSYWEEDDTLERRVFDCMFDSTLCWIMGGFNRAKLIYYVQMGSSGMTRRYFEMYNLMGDGAIDVYSLEPSQLTVIHPPVIPLGSYPMNVMVSDAGGPVQNALVCASAKEDTVVFAAGYTDASGEVVLVVNTTQPDSIYVTVTGHNLEPYLGAALALPSGGPYVMHLRHTVDDSAGGNNDGIVNPGETINLLMWVKNWGSSAAQNVRTWLRTSDSNITLLDSLKVFGDIGAGDSAWTGSDGFGFTVAASCTNGYVLRFLVSTRDANDSVWETRLNLFVGAPVLDYAACQADDPPPGGNGNGMIDPGETGDLIVTLRNTGQGNAYGVTAVLRSGDSRLAVLDSIGLFDDILRDTTGNNNSDRFRVQADNSIPRETQIPCTLHIQTGEVSYVRVFQLGIGVIRICDPIPDGPRAPSLYYAYDVTDTLYTQAPVFSWVEIRDVGTRLSLSDDETEQVSLPSSFGPWLYYGQSFDQISICGNGWVAPGQTSRSTYNNTSLPNTSESGMVVLNWDDLYPPAGNGVWYYHDEANYRFIIEYDSVHYYSPRSSWDKFELIIYDTTMTTLSGDNVFVVQYLTGNNYTSNTVGLQDPTKAIAIQCLYNGSYHRGAAPLVSRMAVKYTTSPPTVGIAENETGRPLPVSLKLGPCVPNPFRRSTRISFGVPRETEVCLAVFDAVGRRVVDLMRGRVRPGIHTVVWDGRDSQDRQAAKGVYIYRLETEAGFLSRKMVVVE